MTPTTAPKVWILDDSPLEAEIASRALGHRARVEVFTDAASMLERIASGPLPEVLVLDARLPGISGAEVCRYVREGHDETLLPILMLTVDGQKSSVVAALQAGANDYVTKPFDGEELWARVASLARIQELFARVQAAERGRELAAQTLRSERERLSVLFAQTPAAVCVFSGPRHEVEYMNPAFAAVAGGSVALGRPAGEGVRGLRPLFEPLDRVLSTGEAHQTQAVPLSPEGAGPDRYLKVSYQPRRDPVGEVTGIDLFAFDVTDQVLRRRKLEDLLSVASHELRTPLAAMQLHVHLLRKGASAECGAPPAEVHRHLRAIDRQVVRQVRLIEDLIDVSRLSADGLRLEPVETDLAAFTADLIGRFLEDRGAGPSLELHAPGPLLVEVDRFRYEQIVTNLLTNATKYGSGQPVNATVEGVGTLRVRISIRDQGMGIAPLDLERIFDRFERAVSVRQHAGLGLGLWITRRLVESMGGTITVLSAVGQGSTFTVELPRRSAR